MCGFKNNPDIKRPKGIITVYKVFCINEENKLPQTCSASGGIFKIGDNVWNKERWKKYYNYTRFNFWTINNIKQQGFQCFINQNDAQNYANCKYVSGDIVMPVTIDSKNIVKMTMTHDLLKREKINNKEPLIEVTKFHLSEKNWNK
jgi:hypothetical protein